MTDLQHRQALALFRYGPVTSFLPLPKGHNLNRGFATSASAEDFFSGLKRVGLRV